MSNLKSSSVSPKNKKEKSFYDDIERVGVDKPLAYLPIDTIRNINGQDPLEVMKQAKKNGYYAKIFSEKKSGIHSGALFVADLNSLRKLLEKNVDLLKIYRWPTDPVDFIKVILKEVAPEKCQLFDLVADAYGDHNNPGRTSVGDKLTVVR